VTLDLLVIVQVVESLTREVLRGGRNGEVTVNLLQLWQGEVTKVSGHGQCTLDGGQVVKRNVLQQRVVENTELTIDLSQVGQR